MRAIILISLLFTGCASTLTVEYDSMNRVSKVSGRGMQNTTITQEDYTVSMDNKQPPILKDIVSINALRGGDN